MNRYVVEGWLGGFRLPPFPVSLYVFLFVSVSLFISVTVSLYLCVCLYVSVYLCVSISISLSLVPFSMHSSSWKICYDSDISNILVYPKQSMLHFHSFLPGLSVGPSFIQAMLLQCSSNTGKLFHNLFYASFII